MLKHKLLLGDGSVLTSGETTGNALRSVTLTEQVSDGTDLCPGAACAACAELEIWVPEGRLNLAQGDELTLLRLDTEAGTETAAGIFLAEKPTRASANVYRITAYDRMTIPRVKGERREVRRMLAERSRKLLDRYRAGNPVDPEICPLAAAVAAIKKLPSGT